MDFFSRFDEEGEMIIGESLSNLCLWEGSKEKRQDCLEEICPDRSAVKAVTSDNNAPSLSPRAIVSAGGLFVKRRWLIGLSDYLLAVRPDLWANNDDKAVTGYTQGLVEI